MTSASNFFRRKGITKVKAVNTGMALVLILLIIFLNMQRPLLVWLAVAALVLGMLAPSLYLPLAWAWYGFARLLGAVVSRLLLTVVFFLVVTPVGWIRRLAGKDALRLKCFKTGHGSVLRTTDHKFTPQDLEHPF
jgi:hypothetical protein